MKVTRIEASGTADVYNMEVEETHDFAVANGVIVHNCYDAWRYACQRYAITSPLEPEKKPKPYDPLDPLDDYYRTNDAGRYDFFRQY